MTPRQLRTVTSAGLLALVLLAMTRTAHAEGALRIRGVDVSRFPDVSVTVALDGGAANAVTIRENGAPVQPSSVRDIAEAGAAVDVVLVLDVSSSMQGAPLASARAAARAFIERLPDDMHAGLLAFDATPTPLTPIGPDHAASLRALEGLEAGGGTALYDAVVRAAAMFTRTAQRTIVLLSDGRDLDSTAGADAALAAARDAGASIEAVALEGRAADHAPLRALAGATDGRFTPATAEGLEALYERLARSLADQVVVTYRSQAEPGAQLDIAVTSPAGTDAALALAPSRPAVSGPGWFSGPAALAALLGVTFLAFFVLLVMLIGTGARLRRERILAQRLAAENRPVTPSAAMLSDRVKSSIVSAGERVARAGGFVGTVDQRLERAGLPLRSGELVALTVAAAFGGAAIVAVLLPGILTAFAAAIVVGAIPALVVEWTARRRMNRLHAQLADTLTILASSLRAGHSFLQALDTVAQEIGDPAAHEFSRVVAEVRLGRPVDDALAAMAERVGSDDFRWAVMAVAIQREVGGNLAEVLDRVAETIRERDTIRRQVDVLSSEGRLSVWILTALPFLLTLYMLRVNPDYLAPLWETTVGLAMTTIAGGLLIVGIAWMRKVVKIDV